MVEGSATEPMVSEEKAGFWRRLAAPFAPLYAGWLAIAARFGFSQTLVVLGLFYAFLIGPFALGTMIGRRDFLSKRGLGGDGSAWRPADTTAPELERSKQQF